MIQQALVLYAVADGVATVTLNRPEKLNALNADLFSELDDALDEAHRDEEVRAVVLTGAGRAFCAGADLGGSDETGPAQRWQRYEASNARQFGLWDLPKPVIAAVHGYCIGRGCELALWCDVVVASADARIGQPEIRDGSFVASIVPWLVGMQRAKLFMLSGDLLAATEAERIGLIAQCVPEGQALIAAQSLARKIAHLPVPAAQAVKRMVNQVYEVRGIRSTQLAGTLLSTVLAGLTPDDKGTEELERIRRDEGFRAYVTARDAPFVES